MQVAIGWSAIVAAAALTLGNSAHADESFLFPAEVVAAWSLGAVARPSTYVWADPISLAIPASGDPRIQAYLIGAVTTQARFLNVATKVREEHNFIIYTDSRFTTDLLNTEGPEYFEAFGLPPDAARSVFARVMNMVATTACGVMPIPNPEGQLKLFLAVNFYPFETAEFPKCAEMITLRGFGAYLREENFNDGAPYRFLVETYAAADRNHPFASISRDGNGK
jgi:hypothetical protein